MDFQAEENLSASFPSSRWRMRLIAICFTSLILLIIPLSLAPLKSHEQAGNLGERYSVEITRELVLTTFYEYRIAVLNRVVGDFEISDGGSPDLYRISGTGTGSTTITDLPGDCIAPPSPHSYSYQAVINGYISILPNFNGIIEKQVTIGGDPIDGSIFGAYTVWCNTGGDTSGQGIPYSPNYGVGAGVNALLEELTSATGKTVRIEHLPGDPIESEIVTAKISPLPPEVIRVSVDKEILNPTDASPRAKVTITATGLDGKGVKQMPIVIKVCTEVGSKNTDGHMHDSRSDKCDKGNRPQAILQYQGVPHRGTFTAKTNDAGQIIFDYEPPFSFRVFKNEKTGVSTTSTTQKLYIAGKDVITATKESDDSVKGESSITTKVQGLQQMPGSATCAGNSNYYFAQQGKHECIFYSTPATNEAMARIAKAFVDKQTECKSQPGGKCSLTTASGENVTLTIVGDVKKVKITAMTLPWGGIHDIAGDWKNPHVTHSRGKAVDIGLADYRIPVTASGKTTMKLDEDRMRLLWHIISLDPNFSNFEAGEGSPFSTKVSHFHANFRS
jgi:hypothetical protein